MRDKLGIVLGEASTWRGVVMLLAGFGIIEADAQHVEMLTGGALCLSGAIGVLFRRGD